MEPKTITDPKSVVSEIKHKAFSKFIPEEKISFIFEGLQDEYRIAAIIAERVILYISIKNGSKLFCKWANVRIPPHGKRRLIVA